jgi:ATP-dependent exoDNAse (exonuclease V) alpha subunit
VNLANDATTIHSLLHFYNSETFEYQVKSKGLQNSFRKAECHRLIIDEVSMMQADMLAGILHAADDEGVTVVLTVAARAKRETRGCGFVRGWRPRARHHR